MTLTRRQFSSNREGFLRYGHDRYFQLTTAAIRKYDPNHFCLGPRMRGPFLKSAPVMQAAGKYLDALSLNVYNYWAPPADLMTMWSGQSGKPFLVTEWYTKGEDSGYPNTSGAGWNCPTQRDRGWFYQNFTLAAGVEELRRLALVQRPGQFSDRSFQPRFQQGYREPLPTERVSI